jgi:hypothetical protein
MYQKWKENKYMFTFRMDQLWIKIEHGSIEPQSYLEKSKNGYGPIIGIYLSKSTIWI